MCGSASRLSITFSRLRNASLRYSCSCSSLTPCAFEVFCTEFAQGPCAVPDAWLIALAIDSGEHSSESHASVHFRVDTPAFLATPLIRPLLSFAVKSWLMAAVIVPCFAPVLVRPLLSTPYTFVPSNLSLIALPTLPHPSPKSITTCFQGFLGPSCCLALFRISSASFSDSTHPLVTIHSAESSIHVVHGPLLCFAFGSSSRTTSFSAVRSSRAEYSACFPPRIFASLPLAASILRIVGARMTTGPFAGGSFSWIQILIAPATSCLSASRLSFSHSSPLSAHAARPLAMSIALTLAFSHFCSQPLVSLSACLPWSTSSATHAQILSPR